VSRLGPIEGVATADTLVLHEIYASIQGESTHAGRPCTFVRTTACNLRCVWCDTPHAFGEGKAWTRAEVLGEIATLGNRLVEITGGEPLLQPGVLPLMTELCDRDYDVLLETSGSLDISGVDPRVVRVVDFKAPSSGEAERNLLSNVEALGPHDEVKLVLSHRADYEWARAFVAEHELARRCVVLLSPVFGVLSPRDLAAWMLADGLAARLNLQIHKVIWDPGARGV
jgi:7-carboxy-7-deazaguanine synthase